MSRAVRERPVASRVRRISTQDGWRRFWCLGSAMNKRTKNKLAARALAECLGDPVLDVPFRLMRADYLYTFSSESTAM